MTPRSLSKSRFKLALECPTRAFYSLDGRYVDTRDEDEFLQALADGGFQVGALAKAMYRARDPDAVEIEARDQGEQIRQTAELLECENVTIFEATIRHGNMLVRVDVLLKRGKQVELIEVKSKSFDPTQDSFTGKRGAFRAEWLPYLQDVAFQAYVMREAYPRFEVLPSLLLVDPSVVCSVDGLGTAIRVDRGEDNRPNVEVDPAFDVTRQQQPLLRKHDVRIHVAEILDGLVETPTGTHGFVEFANETARLLAAGTPPRPAPGKQCKKCEFYCDPEEITAETRSGWHECMETRFAGADKVPRTRTVFALYNHRKAEELLNKGKLRLAELDEEDVGEEESPEAIAPAHRHQLQVAEARGEDATLIRTEALKHAFESWRFPLHFIDFETSRPTLPFTAGRRPNQHLLFQFSHHVMDERGHVEHRTDCLIAEPGVVPNAAVVRALKAALERDDGTVLHWWDHERTVLKDMRDELAASEEPDREELVRFITSLVEGADGRPPRLVDMGRPLVARTAYIVGTEGRSSIKKVLQAMLAQSPYLREKYSRPMYGTPEMPSLNFRAQTWWREAHGHVVDPYTLLGQLLADPELDALARAEEEEEASYFVANGGAAMVAYGELQRRDLPQKERERLEKQLKRYCELDTLAMVMVYEALREMVRG